VWWFRHLGIGESALLEVSSPHFFYEEQMDFKTFNYIIYEDETNPKTYYMGLNRFNTPGYIDDGAGWSDEEMESLEEELLHKIDEFIEPWETMSFTYFVHKLDGLREALNKLGLTEQEQAWGK
jgi:hypothetical protein